MKTWNYGVTTVQRGYLDAAKGISIEVVGGYITAAWMRAPATGKPMAWAAD